MANNRVWAKAVNERSPGFFARLSKQQAPEYLWIGCSDSRVPASQIVSLPPGEIFVHRNIANVVVADDINCLSVIQYAIEILKVKHVVVCGHYGCGGVKAALGGEQHGLMDEWLEHIRDVARNHAAQLDALTEDQRFERLCELNVASQVKHVCATPMVQQAWRKGRDLAVHGWIYSIGNGILKDLEVGQG